MPKFTLVAEHTDENGEVYSKVTHEFTEDYLYDVVMHLQEFLRGVGYYFDGDLNVGEEEPVKFKVPSPEDDQDPLGTVAHNSYYFDTTRNR